MRKNCKLTYLILFWCYICNSYILRIPVICCTFTRYGCSLQTATRYAVYFHSKSQIACAIGLPPQRLENRREYLLCYHFANQNNKNISRCAIKFINLCHIPRLLHVTEAFNLPVALMHCNKPVTWQIIMIESILI